MGWRLLGTLGRFTEELGGVGEEDVAGEAEDEVAGDGLLTDAKMASLCTVEVGILT